jgi:hypothetical protein
MHVSREWLAPLAILLTVVIIAAGCTAGGGGASLSEDTGGWSLIPLDITESSAGSGETHVRVEFAARNDSDDWSAMRPADAEERPTSLVTEGGKSYTCETVQVGSGGHYLPPGFQIRGYLNRKGELQAIFVECTVPEGSLSGARLSIPYIAAVGEYDYYEKGDNIRDGQITVEIDPEQSPPDLAYPVASSLEVEVHPLTEPIIALNKCPLTLVEATRSDEGFSFKWTIFNPGEYNTLVHIGRPPAVGEDGIVYGAWVSPDLVEVPIAQPNEMIEIETQSAVPPDVVAPYMLLSVEQKRERLFSNYLVDLSEVE